MTQEEKARAYDKAIERAKRMFSEKELNYLFPEFVESEDERIRKALLEYFGEECDTATINGIYCYKIYAWLEKQEEKDKLIQELGKYKVKYTQEILNKHLENQGEQKSTNKVEPKFKVGDWIISNNKKSTYQVIEVKRGIYVILDNADNHEYHIGIKECEKSGSLWNISDAKDGDVLTWDDSKCIALFKNIYDEVSFNSYGCVGHCTGTFDSGLPYHDIEGVHPATKEQRDLLLSKMHYAGYEWDKEKKELRKIEKQVPKPKWTDEYEKYIETTISFLKDFADNGYENAVACIDWLKSLKQRMSE